MATVKQYTMKNGKTAWMYQTYLGKDPSTGKDKQTTKRGFKSKKEAQLALSKKLVDIDKRGLQQYATQPFSVIYQEWFKQYKTTVKESTYAKTDEHFTLHILPEIGDIPLNNLKTIDIQTAVNKWFNERLSRYKRFFNYVSKVLDWAYKMQIIADNPAKRVTIPVNKEQIKTTKTNYYDLEELKHFFECLNDLDDPQASMYFRLLAFTGMRKGESLALTWNDVNFETNQINIIKTQSQGMHGRLLVTTPKTDASTRIVNVDNKTMAMLKQWRMEQRKRLLMLGFNTLTPDQLIFTSIKNTMLNPVKPRKWLQTVIKRFDLKQITVHGFRRTYATLAFEAGASIKEVQEQLGHSDYKTTMDIYTEVTSAKKKETAIKYAKYVNF